jgi:hypothetical protein
LIIECDFFIVGSVVDMLMACRVPLAERVFC